MSRQSDSPPSALSDEDLIERIIDEYLALYDEIEDGERAEHDLMPRVVDHLFVGALGWSRKDYEQEDDWNDVRFYDQERNPVIIVEGKRRDVDVEEGIAQVFRYASETPYAQYFASTNVDEFRLYKRCDATDENAITHHGVSAQKIADVPFEGICNRARGASLDDELTTAERQELHRLTRILKDELLNEGRYEDFSIETQQSVATDKGFDNLLDALSTCLEQQFLPYTLDAFDEFMDRYSVYEREREELVEQIERLKDAGHDDTEIAELEDQLAELEDEYEIYHQFHNDYQTWVRLSNRQEDDEGDNKEVFCRESVYVQLNKILLIRIAEDKDLVNQMVSNGGVHRYFDFWDDFTKYVDRDYVDLFETACEELSEVYDYLYSRRLFDWELREDDSYLDTVLQRTLWHLNHYDFENVDRDVLGHLYQEHIPPEERKQLGEFYTPVSVVDLILDSVGYTPDKHLEGDEYDLLDPACGSGTFLVRAANRLLERLDNKGGVDPRDAIEIVQSRLYGFDLNPFATHIAELNLLFQVIDLYKQVKEDDSSYTLDRFNIYRTDSLRVETQESLTALHSSAIQRQYREERREANKLKRRDDYGFVVGNPPYVRIQNIPKGKARDEYDSYETAHYNYDIYILFMERAADWLAEDGKLGFITPNKFTENRYGEKIQDFLIQNYRIQEIINFGDVSVFEGVQSYPLIFVGERMNKDEPFRSADDFELREDYSFTYAGVTAKLPEITQTALNGSDNSGSTQDDDEGEIAELIRACLPATPGDEPPSLGDVQARLEEIAPEVDLSQLPLNAYPIRASMLTDDGEWQFVPQDEHAVMESIDAGGKQFREFDGATVNNGVQTGANDIFVLDRETIDEYGIEDELVHPTLGGRDVVRWYTAVGDKYILYTTPATNLDAFSGGKKYLEDNRETLEERYCVRDNRRDWYELAEYRPGVFDREKVVTPDICYYSNFFLDTDGAFYSLNSTYVIFSDELPGDYLVGILNSDAVQFYIRRTAPQYGNDYLRYQSDYLLSMSIPDPASDEIDEDLVEAVSATARDLGEVAQRYHKAKELHQSPGLVFEQVDVDRASLSYAGYIESMGYEVGDGDVSPTVTESTVRLNVQDTIEFVDEETAEAFVQVLNTFDVESVRELDEFQFPSSSDGLIAVADAFDEVDRTVDGAVDEAKGLEETLNEKVFGLYGLSDEHRELIEKRVDKPENPLEAKVR